MPPAILIKILGTKKRRYSLETLCRVRYFNSELTFIKQHLLLKFEGCVFYVCQTPNTTAHANTLFLLLEMNIEIIFNCSVFRNLLMKMVESLSAQKVPGIPV